MIPWKKMGMVALAAGLLVGGLEHSSVAATARKRSAGAAKPKAPAADSQHITSDPGSATIHEHDLLHWEAVDPPNRAKNDEFFFRGVLMDITEVEGQKNLYTLKVLPISILENEERSIDFNQFNNGVSVTREVLDKKWLNNFKKGNVVEIKQYYEVKEESAMGHAHMQDFIFHQDIMPYPVSSQAWIKTPGLQMEQYMNAMKGVEMASDKGSGDHAFQDALDALASSAPDPAVKAKATELLSSIFNAKPTGKPMMKPAPGVPTEPENPKAKKAS